MSKHPNFQRYADSEKTLIHFCEQFGIDPKTLERDATLLGVELGELTFHLAQEALNAPERNYMPQSITSIIEATWKRIRLENISENISEVIAGHLVVFIPLEETAIAQGHWIAAGAVKSVYTTSS